MLLPGSRARLGLNGRLWSVFLVGEYGGRREEAWKRILPFLKWHWWSSLLCQAQGWSYNKWVGAISWSSQLMWHQSWDERSLHSTRKTETQRKGEEDCAWSFSQWQTWILLPHLVGPSVCQPRPQTIRNSKVPGWIRRLWPVLPGQPEDFKWATRRVPKG